MKKQFLFLITILVNMTIYSQKIVNEKLIPVCNKLGKWGYIDAITNKIVIEPKYDFANLFENGIAAVGNINPKSKERDIKYLSGYIRENGDEVLPLIFSENFDAKNSNNEIVDGLRLIVLENGTNGILKELEGKWLIEPGKYEDFKFYKPNQFLADNIDFYDDGIKYSAPKGCKIKHIDFENRMFEITKGNDDSFYGICTWEGKIIVEPKYIDVQYFPQTKTFLASTVSGKITVANIENKKVENTLFDQNGKLIHTFLSKKIPFVSENETYGTFDYQDKTLCFDLKTGQLIDVPKSDFEKNNNLFQDSKTKLFGLKNELETIKIQAIYEELKFINQDVIIAINKSGLYGLIDNNGTIIMPFQYRYLTYSGNRIIADLNDKHGAFDYKGKQVIACKYLYSFSFNIGLAEVHSNTGVGIIDTDGNVIIPTIYSNISRQETNQDSVATKSRIADKDFVYFTAEKDKKWGLFDSKGKLILPFEYGFISKPSYDKDFVKGWIKIEDAKRDKSGLYNILNNTVIQPIFRGITIYDDFLVANNSVDNNDFYQLLNINGKPITDEVYNKMDIYDNFFIVEKERKHGIINFKSEILIPIKYNYIWVESKNLIRVWDGETYFFVNILTRKEYKIG